jgi:enoyl-CoA hydratase/carnithine racemase
MSTCVTRSDRDGVVELRLARAESRNALTTEMLRELRDHLRDLRGDERAGAVLLSGDGAVFCAGADLHEFPADAPPGGRDNRFRLVGDVIARLLAVEQPTISSVQGAAVGAGWGLALACDVCFASAAATFSLPEVAKGFRIPEPLMRRLAQLAGPMRATELAFVGTRLSAADACAIGCVTRVLADDEALRADAWAFAAMLAARPRASVAAVTQLRTSAALAPELEWTEE